MVCIPILSTITSNMPNVRHYSRLIASFKMLEGIHFMCFGYSESDVRNGIDFFFFLLIHISNSIHLWTQLKFLWMKTRFNIKNSLFSIRFTIFIRCIEISEPNIKQLLHGKDEKKKWFFCCWMEEMDSTLYATKMNEIIFFFPSQPSLTFPVSFW